MYVEADEAPNTFFSCGHFVCRRRVQLGVWGSSPFLLYDAANAGAGARHLKQVPNTAYCADTPKILRAKFNARSRQSTRLVRLVEHFAAQP